MAYCYSIATGVAIARLLSDASPSVVHEAAEFAELARVRLALDNAAMSAAVMFAQPLIKMWQPHWKFAYTIGLSLGVKYTTDGFYVVDIIDHVTKEFSLEFLKEGERLALGMIDWNNMNQCCTTFRNALVSVALELPALPVETTIASEAEAWGDPSNQELHVLIVDDSETVCKIHKACVLAIRPRATVSVVFRCPASILPSLVTHPSSGYFTIRTPYKHSSAGIASCMLSTRITSYKLSHACMMVSRLSRTTSRRVDDAVQYVRDHDNAGSSVNLILLDFCLTVPPREFVSEKDCDEVRPLARAHSAPFICRADSILFQCLTVF